MTTRLLAPHRHGRGALHHRPFIFVDIDNRVAIRRAAFPCGAEAVLGEFPGALASRARLVLRLARDLAVTAERQLELGARGGRSREGLAVEELALDFLRHELAGSKRSAGQKDGNGDARKHGTHTVLPRDLADSMIRQLTLGREAQRDALLVALARPKAKADAVAVAEVAAIDPLIGHAAA